MSAVQVNSSTIVVRSAFSLAIEHSVSWGIFYTVAPVLGERVAVDIGALFLGYFVSCGFITGTFG